MESYPAQSGELSRFTTSMMNYRNLVIVGMWAARVCAGVDPQIDPPIPGPILSITRSDALVNLTFKGTLQSAAGVAGPWRDVPDAVTPYQPPPGFAANFYRARTPDSIFITNTVVAFALSGPFQEHFELAFAGLPDGIFPPVREKPYFDGTLSMPGFEIPVSVRVRGNSSLQECPFPKLKFKISKSERGATPFFDAREVKLGTHCAEGGRGNIGRLREQIAAYREVLAYEAMRELGFIAPRVRRARVDYFDTTSTNVSPMAGWNLSREALILDDIEVVAERLGGRALDDEEIAALTDAHFDEQLITDLQFFHALIGNWDYELSVDGLGLWNTDVIERAGGDLVPVAGDFDLASWVTGVPRFMGPGSYKPGLPDVQREAFYELEQIQSQVSAARFTSAGERFNAGRAAIETLVNSAQLDAAGRTNCLLHIAAFYDALHAMER